MICTWWSVNCGRYFHWSLPGCCFISFICTSNLVSDFSRCNKYVSNTWFKKMTVWSSWVNSFCDLPQPIKYLKDINFINDGYRRSHSDYKWYQLSFLLDCFSSLMLKIWLEFATILENYCTNLSETFVFSSVLELLTRDLLHQM